MNTAQLRALFLFFIIICAALVMLGALAKIQHWPVGNLLLVIGMIGEIVCAVGLAASSIFSRKDK
jgi:hypothetical protein